MTGVDKDNVTPASLAPMVEGVAEVGDLANTDIQEGGGVWSNIPRIMTLRSIHQLFRWIDHDFLATPMSPFNDFYAIRYTYKKSVVIWEQLLAHLKVSFYAYTNIVVFTLYCKPYYAYHTFVITMYSVFLYSPCVRRTFTTIHSAHLSGICCC